jgi:hypothetical protein
VGGHEHLHRAVHAWLDVGERDDGDGGLGAGKPLVRSVILLLVHFNDEELFALLLVPVSEEFITMEAHVILTPLSDLSRREAKGRCRE